MSKKLIINVALIVLTYIIPIYIFRIYQDDINIYYIQTIVFVVLMLGSILLAYLNHVNRLKIQNSKYLWAIFEVVGIFGLVYSLFILYLIFSFRHGISF